MLYSRNKNKVINLVNLLLIKSFFVSVFLLHQWVSNAPKLSLGSSSEQETNEVKESQCDVLSTLVMWRSHSLGDTLSQTTRHSDTRRLAIWEARLPLSWCCWRCYENNVVMQYITVCDAISNCTCVLNLMMVGICYWLNMWPLCLVI